MHDSILPNGEQEGKERTGPQKSFNSKDRILVTDFTQPSSTNKEVSLSEEQALDPYACGRSFMFKPYLELVVFNWLNWDYRFLVGHTQKNISLENVCAVYCIEICLLTAKG